MEHSVVIHTPTAQNVVTDVTCPQTHWVSASCYERVYNSMEALSGFQTHDLAYDC